MSSEVVIVLIWAEDESNTITKPYIHSSCPKETTPPDTIIVRPKIQIQHNEFHLEVIY